MTGMQEPLPGQNHIFRSVFSVPGGRWECQRKETWGCSWQAVLFIQRSATVRDLQKNRIKHKLELMGWGTEFATCFLTCFKLVLFLPQSQIMSSLKRKAKLALKL